MREVTLITLNFFILSNLLNLLNNSSGKMWWRCWLLITDQTEKFDFDLVLKVKRSGPKISLPGFVKLYFQSCRNSTLGNAEGLDGVMAFTGNGLNFGQFTAKG